MKRSHEYKHALLIIKSTFCQKVIVHKDKNPFHKQSEKTCMCGRVRSRDFTVTSKATFLKASLPFHKCRYSVDLHLRIFLERGTC